MAEKIERVEIGSEHRREELRSGIIELRRATTEIQNSIRQVFGLPYDPEAYAGERLRGEEYFSTPSVELATHFAAVKSIRRVLQKWVHEAWELHGMAKALDEKTAEKDILNLTIELAVYDHLTEVDIEATIFIQTVTSVAAPLLEPSKEEENSLEEAAQYRSDPEMLEAVKEHVESIRARIESLQEYYSGVHEVPGASNYLSEFCNFETARLADLLAFLESKAETKH